jgi:hypothetical protein
MFVASEEGAHRPRNVGDSRDYGALVRERGRPEESRQLPTLAVVPLELGQIGQILLQEAVRSALDPPDVQRVPLDEVSPEPAGSAAQRCAGGSRWLKAPTRAPRHPLNRRDPLDDTTAYRVGDHPASGLS